MTVLVMAILCFQVWWNMEPWVHLWGQQLYRLSTDHTVSTTLILSLFVFLCYLCLFFLCPFDMSVIIAEIFAIALQLKILDA